MKDDQGLELCRAYRAKEAAFSEAFERSTRDGRFVDGDALDILADLRKDANMAWGVYLAHVRQWVASRG